MPLLIQIIRDGMTFSDFRNHLKKKLHLVDIRDDFGRVMLMLDFHTPFSPFFGGLRTESSPHRIYAAIRINALKKRLHDKKSPFFGKINVLHLYFVHNGVYYLISFLWGSSSVG